MYHFTYLPCGANNSALLTVKNQERSFIDICHLYWDCFYIFVTFYQLKITLIKHFTLFVSLLKNRQQIFLSWIIQWHFHYGDIWWCPEPTLWLYTPKTQVVGDYSVVKKTRSRFKIQMLSTDSLILLEIKKTRIYKLCLTHTQKRIQNKTRKISHLDAKCFTANRKLGNM